MRAPPGKPRLIGSDDSELSARFETLVSERFSLATARRPEEFLRRVSRYASAEAHASWLQAYSSNSGSFVDHAVWGADRDLGDGRWLYGAMDNRYATNAARVIGGGGLDIDQDIRDKRVCVVGAWDGTECLLMYALGACEVDAVEEVPEFCEMAAAQYETWLVPGEVFRQSLYDVAPARLYDTIYVPGVMYHLTDMVSGSLALWSMLKHGGKLATESAVDELTEKCARYTGPLEPGWNWWIPSAACLEALLADCGFDEVHRVEEPRRGRGWWVGRKSTSAPRAATSGRAGLFKPNALRERLERPSKEPDET